MANISKIKVGDTSYGITATPTAHDSTATTYGAASASNYGHVKLSDNYTSSAGAAASGIGASSLAVYNAYNTLNSNLNILYSRISWYTLENLETTLDLPIHHNRGAVVFAYWRGDAGHNGTPIICFTIRRSNDGSVAVVNNLDGSESTITATCNDNGVTVDFTPLSIWGYIRVLVLHLI